ncbi:DUF4159 domain-containing protein [Wenxinia saemankumensis]|uniref:N-terminal double-transmembrane domain-containing protein n=1 Tax=Wenxinia saemankumensis TaxID=1447782 RepID=A0A1M6C0C2_9RHOB|nr:DUF4159 domain-containing protein [Wenxinia saemankumensis]SHI54509.1 N-terminal double-transmembrane domain-containing protein [Wenxinia saemankumensis]
MLTLGPLGFTAPWLLLGLAALPVLWLILRAVPPAPIRRRFPGVALLLGLTDDEAQTDRTPWWLLLLRMAAVAAVILAFAGPILNPRAEEGGSGPLLVALDASWADARDWAQRIDRVEALLDEAATDGRPVFVAALTDPPAGGAVFSDPAAARSALPALEPKPWAPGTAAQDWAEALEGGFDTIWLSDGLDRPGRAELLAAFEARGSVRVYQSPRQVLALRPATTEDGQVAVQAIRTPTGPETEARVAAIGLDPAGIERQLAAAPATFAAGEGVATAAFDLPPELRNRVTRFEVVGQRSAGAVTLADDSLRRREIALVAGGSDEEGLELLAPLYYLRNALEPNADLLEGPLSDLVPANPDVIVLADVATLSETERAEVEDWVRGGGLLLRFAGPRLAASDVGRTTEDVLMPVRLRAGGRNVGGAMSWGEPKTLAPFAEDSPFYGLAVPEDVTVGAQVMAQPDPSLAASVIAQLSDGTPLVTRSALGQGQVVLFHVTANAEWSTLPLSGLFVRMLERLSVSTRPGAAEIEEMEGTVWTPEEVLDAAGRLERVDTMPGVPGERLVAPEPGPDLPPGLYAGEDRRLAVNVIGAEDTLAPAAWPSRIPIEGLAVLRELPLKGWLLAAAAAALMIDVIAALALSGKLGRPAARSASRAAALVLAVLAGGLSQPREARAQESGPEDAFAVEATESVVLAHVLTGDPQVDETAAAGLLGLSRVLAARTSVEPATPMGVDLERDELAFFPVLYWPVTADQPIPSDAAYEKLNTYLRSGGMILFDTRDADLGGFGSQTPEGRKLQALALPLDIPPLEPVPEDHVLTRTFYLLQDFPGRYNSRDIWVEASPPDAQAVEGMPFRNLNDGVTPVVVGGNDWAAAWAVGENGSYLYPVGRGMAGERQREIAFRFGVNLVMHVLTGNYKSDQVHVPALLERLGQ